MRKWIALIVFSFVSLVVHCQGNSRYVLVNLNLRSAPNTNSSIITTIPKGTVVNIEDDCDCAWIPIYYNGYLGYVSTAYLSKVNKPKNAIATPLSHVKYYTNSSGNRVQSPTHYNAPPRGATALCRDGTYSFSQSRRGTCSHHGGVLRWLN